MYQLIKATKKTSFDSYDYVFQDFKSMYLICNILTVPLKGMYRIAVKSDWETDIKEFIKVEQSFATMIIDIYCPEAVIDDLSMRDQNIPIKDTVSAYQQFLDLIQSKSILFDNKKTIQVLYNSISHEYSEMDMILSELNRDRDTTAVLTQQEISKKVILKSVVYPRQVLIDYLILGRYRKSKLEKCISCMGKDVVLWSMVKTITSMVEQKQVYYRTAKSNWILDKIDTFNLILMYRVLVVERGRIRDITLLLELYERGLSSYDTVFEEEDTF